MKKLRSGLRELLSHPPSLAVRRWRMARSGTFREREHLGLVERENYAYGMIRAADMARFLGKKKATVCEFGVATGNGLVNLIELAGQVTAETGVEFRIVGLDTGEGLPTIEGFRDHPELWSVGDFPMFNRGQLVERIGGRAELIFGDIKDTGARLVESLDPEAPLGFVSIDVDLYSGARSALACLRGEPSLYAPAISMYFDDVRFFFANKWCGELYAIEEFNGQNEMRKIDQDRSLPGWRPSGFQDWHAAMYVCHILDHPVRVQPVRREGLTLEQHLKLTREAGF